MGCTISKESVIHKGTQEFAAECRVSSDSSTSDIVKWSQKRAYQRVTDVLAVEASVQNDRDIMSATVEVWKRENIYVSRSVEEVKKTIASSACVCVIGVPGAGKSTALHHAALSLEKEKFVIYSISGPQEFLKYYNSKLKQLFVLDDALGVNSVDNDKVVSWQEHNEKVKNTLICSKATKLLVSVKTQIYRSVRDKQLVFLDPSLICTDHVDFRVYKLGIGDMRGMLKHCMTDNVVDVDIILKVIKQIWRYTETELTVMTEEDRQNAMSEYTAGVDFLDCFPLLCKVFVATDFMKQDPRKFFEDPFQALIKVFNNIKSDNELQFCALVLCAVFDGKLNDDMFSTICELRNQVDHEDVKIRNIIMNAFHLKNHLHEVKFALKSLNGVYITYSENKYNMSHVVFHNIVIYLFNDTDPMFVLQYGKMQMIHDRIRLGRAKPTDDQYMIMINGENNIDRLADRLFRELKSNSVIGARFIVNNSNINDEQLISSLKKKLSDGEQTNKELIDELFEQCIDIAKKDEDTDQNHEIIQYNLICMCVHTGLVDREQIINLFRWCMWTLMIYRRSYEHGYADLYKLIQLCVQEGVDCNQKVGGELGNRYPLQISVGTGSLKLTKLLLDKKVDIRKYDGHNYSHQELYSMTKNNLKLT